MRLSDIARASGVSILELARMVTTPRNLEDLGRVAQLHAIEREMLLGKLKRNALMRLRELTDEVSAASGDEVRACEVMRKACVDLLRNGGGTTSSTAPLRSQSPPPGPDTLSPLGEEKILEYLEQLGEEKYEHEPGEPPGPPRRTSGSVVPSPPETTIRTGKMPEPLADMQSKTPLESCLPNDSRSRNGPGVSGGCASGSLCEGTGISGGRASGSSCNRTGGALGLRETCRGIDDRNSTDASQTRFDDAHPP